jgi:hypothetical protein
MEKHIWIPVLVFVVLEALFFIIGLSLVWSVENMCYAAADCPPGSSGNYSYQFSLLGILPSAAAALIAYFLLKKRSGGKSANV